MIYRVLVAAVAVVACAWFALGAREARDTAKATSILDGSSRLSAAQAQRTRSLLSSAATLNPDREVTILKARLALVQGNASAATRLLKGVIDAEPRNLEAWMHLAIADHAPADLAVTIRKLAELDPQLARRRAR